MAPRANDNLPTTGSSSDEKTPLSSSHPLSFSSDDYNKSNNSNNNNSFPTCTTQHKVIGGMIVAAVVVVAGTAIFNPTRMSSPQAAPGPTSTDTMSYPTGPYELVERQEGTKFWDYYDFLDGPDSIGSAGYNTYISKDRALKLGILNVTEEEHEEEFVYMTSAPTPEGPRESIRLEGKRRYNHGLFVLDLHHMPVGCGQWPAFWLTDEEYWPDHGEIDIVEGINYQPMAKTALHTSAMCSMYQQVSEYWYTGKWDRSVGIYNRFTGQPDMETSLPADNCWVKTPHQWENQGCVAVDQRNDTLGVGINKQGGGIYVLEWDPANSNIRSWVFPRAQGIPENLQSSISTASESSSNNRVAPDTSEWGLPYAYFAIGEQSTCSANHFQNMRLIFNLAFCGTVAGNRYFTDCPEVVKKFPTSEEHKYDPVAACQAWIKSEPDELEEAYWKIKGVYVYQRS